MQRTRRAFSIFLAVVLVFACNDAATRPLVALADAEADVQAEADSARIASESSGPTESRGIAEGSLEHERAPEGRQAEGSAGEDAIAGAGSAGRAAADADGPRLEDPERSSEAAMDEGAPGGGPAGDAGGRGEGPAQEGSSGALREPHDLGDEEGALSLSLSAVAYRDADGSEAVAYPVANVVDVSKLDPRKLETLELRYAVQLEPGDRVAGDTFSVKVPRTHLAVDVDRLAEANRADASEVSYAAEDELVVGTLTPEAAARQNSVKLSLRVPLLVRADALGEDLARVKLPLQGDDAVTIVLPAQPAQSASASDAGILPEAFAFAAPLVETTSVALEKEWRDNNDVARPWKEIAEDGTLGIWFTVAGGAKTKLDATTMRELGLDELPRIRATSSGTSRTTYRCEGLPSSVTRQGASKAVAYAIEEDAARALGHGYVQRVVDGALCNVKTTAFAASVTVRDGDAALEVPESRFRLYRASAGGAFVETVEGAVAWDPDTGAYTVSDLPLYDEDGAEIVYRLEASGAAINDEGDCLFAEYDNAAVANHGTDVDACYNGGAVNLTLAGTTEYRAAKAWLDPEGTPGAARPDATFHLWRYTQKGANGFAQASQVRDQDGSLISVPLEGEAKNAGSFPIAVDGLPKFDPEGYRYVYLMREELGASEPSYQQVFGKAVERPDGSIAFEDVLPQGATRSDADRSLYNGGTLSNRISGDCTVEQKKTWKASAYQSDFSDAIVTLTLQSRLKGAGEDAWTATGVAEELVGFVAEITTKTASAHVSRYDELGRELEHRWVETSLMQKGSERLDSSTGRFALDCNVSIDDPANERRDVDWFSSREEPVPGDPDGGTWIVNRLEGEVDYAVDKLWRQLDDKGVPRVDGEGNPLYGKTPPVPGASVTIALYRNGEKMDDRVYKMDGIVDEANRETRPYHLYVDDLPKFDDEGRPFSYTAQEVAGYGSWHSSYAHDAANRTTDIKNDPTGPGNSIRVGKVWIDDSDVNHRYPVTVQVRAKNSDGTAGDAVGGSVVLNAENGWRTWVGVPEGTGYEDYVLEEAAVTKPGAAAYVPDESRGSLTVTTDQHIYLVASGYDAKREMLAVTNKRIGTIDLTVTKTWVDKGADTALRPEAKLRLVCVEYPEAVVQDRVLGTAKVVLPNSGELPVLDGDGRPASSVQTVASDVEAGVEMSYCFYNLPKYDAEGKVVHYAVEEVASDGSSPFGGADYRAFVEQTGYEVGGVHTNDAQAIALKNQRVGTKPVAFHKRWVDDYAYDNGKRPDIYLTIWQKTASAGEADATKAGGSGFVDYRWKTREGGDPSADWTATIPGMNKYDDEGEEIFYYAQESTNGDSSLFDYTPATYLDDGMAPASHGDGSDWVLRPDATTTLLKEGGTFVNAIENNVIIEGRKLWMNVPTGFPYARMPRIKVSVDQWLEGSLVRGAIASTTKLSPVAGTNEFTFSIPKAGDDDPAGADMPKYDERGRLYEYRVSETIVDADPSGTTWESLYEQSGTTLEFKNTYNTGAGNVGSLLVGKTWDRDGDTRAWPAVTFKVHRLYDAGGSGGAVDEVVQTKTHASTSDGGNVVRFDGLLVYAPDGQRFRYYVEEEGVDGFTSSIAGADDAASAVSLAVGGTATATATNAYDRKGSISVAGEKSWNDYADAFGLRPNGGSDIVLELRRTAPAQPGQRNPITEPEVVAATPTWQNEGADTWTYTFGNLDRWAPNGMPWDYQVVEKPHSDGFYGTADKEVGKKIVDADGNVVMEPLENSFAAHAKVEKSWKDDGDRYKLRPTSVTVRLQASDDGGASWADAETMLGALMPGYAFEKRLSGPDWRGSFDNLPPKAPVSAGAASYAYRVAEVGPDPSYKVESTTANGTTAIVNALHDDGVTLTVRKTWNDAGNAFGTRPVKPTDASKWQVAFKLQRAVKADQASEAAWADVVRSDGSLLVETIEGPLESAGETTATFAHLPKYDGRARECVYRAREVADAAPAYGEPVYASSYVENETSVTNHLDAASVSGEKTWTDLDASKRPSEVALVLYRESAAFAKEKVPGDPKPVWSDQATDAWKYAYAGLPKRDRLGNAYAYTVVERPVAPGYWAARDASGLRIANTQTAFKLDKVDARDGTKKVGDVELSVYRLGAEAAGQELAVWSRSAEGVVSVKVEGASMDIGANGEIRGLPQGDYVLKETKTPAAYKTADPVPFTMKADGTVESATSEAVSGSVPGDMTVTMKDELIVTDLAVAKVDGADAATPVAGATLKITGVLADPSMGEIAWTSAEDPRRIAGKLLAGNLYTLEEEGRVSGYLAMSEPVTFKIRPEDGAVAFVSNPVLADGKPAATLSDDGRTLFLRNILITGDARLTKTDDGGAPLAGVTFDLYRAGAGSPLRTGLATAHDGTVSVAGLTEGSYYFLETATLDDKVLDPVKLGFSIGPDQHGATVPVSASNAAFSTEVRLEKVDAADGAPLAGARFALSKRNASGGYDAVGSPVATDVGGVASFSLGSRGAYRVEEVAAADGYEFDAASAYAAEFVVDNIPAFQGGRLDLRESVPDDVARKYALSVANAQYKDGRVANERTLGDVELAKVNADGQAPLNGAEFALHDAATGRRLGLFSVGSAYASPDASPAPAAAGSLSVGGLAWGAYYFEEVAAPSGYRLADERYPFSIGRVDGDVTVSADVGAVENARTRLAFAKLGACVERCSDPSLGAEHPDTARPLAKAEFAVFGDEACTTVAKTADGADAVSASDVDGLVEFRGLAPGAYWVKETKVPRGYVPNDAVHALVIGENGDVERFSAVGATQEAVVSEVVNEALRADIRIKKVAETDEDKVLPGSTYGLYKREAAKRDPLAAARAQLLAADDPLDSSLQLIAKATTDRDGCLAFEGVLTERDYVIRELVAPGGSLVSENPISISFSVGDDGKARVSRFDDGAGTAEFDANGDIVWKEPQVTVAFSKKDPEGALLAGAKLQVVDEDGGVVIEPWTSSADGPQVSTGALTAGKAYRLVELEAPCGYLEAADVAFAVDDPKVGPNENYVQHVEMVDERAAAPPFAPDASSDPAVPQKLASEASARLGAPIARTGDGPFSLIAGGAALAAAGVLVLAGRRRSRAR